MLREILATDVFKLFLLLARLGGAVMLFPGIGSGTVSLRVRLLFTVAVAYLLLPVISPQLPAMPADLISMVLLISSEAAIGIFFGVFLQFLLAALDLAGNFIGYSVGLTNAFTVDPITEQQSQVITGFLNLTALTLIFLTNTHHLMLRGLVDSYTLFRPGESLPVADFADTLVHVLGESFLVGVQLAAPLLVFALTFNTALGLLNRLVPQMQVFFVGMPVQILLGFYVIMIALPAMMLWFLRHFTDGVVPMLAPG
jgi:flagellar biosynthetic protein FliR